MSSDLPAGFTAFHGMKGWKMFLPSGYSVRSLFRPAPRTAWAENLNPAREPLAGAACLLAPGCPTRIITWVSRVGVGLAGGGSVLQLLPRGLLIAGLSNLLMVEAIIWSLHGGKKLRKVERWKMAHLSPINIFLSLLILALSRVPH